MTATAPASTPQADRRNVLPLSLPPPGLSQVEAAAYVGISTTLFDELVKDGRMPRPKRINARTVWDRIQLDQAFEALPEEGAERDDPRANPRV